MLQQVLDKTQVVRVDDVHRSTYWFGRFAGEERGRGSDGGGSQHTKWSAPRRPGLAKISKNAIIKIVGQLVYSLSTTPKTTHASLVAQLSSYLLSG